MQRAIRIGVADAVQKGDMATVGAFVDASRAVDAEVAEMAAQRERLTQVYERVRERLDEAALGQAAETERIAAIERARVDAELVAEEERRVRRALQASAEAERQERVQADVDAATARESRRALGVAERRGYEERAALLAGEARALVRTPAAQRDRRAFGARLKGRICEARALLQWAGEREYATLDVDNALDALRALFNDLYDRAKMFALNPKRYHSKDLWGETARGYARFAVAEEALEWLEGGSVTIKPSSRNPLVDEMAAAEAFLPALFDRHGTGASDVQLNDFRTRLKEWNAEQRESKFVTYWQSRAQGDQLEAIDAVAANLQERLDALRQAVEREARREGSLEALGAFCADPSAEDFERRLRELAVECLEAGVAPSDKDLVDALAPFVSTVKTMREPRLNPLVNALSIRAMQESKDARKAEAEQEGAVDPETARRMAKVRAYLGGKTVLFLGGDKIDARAKERLKEGLGCAELRWPESNGGVSGTRYDADIAASDVVCQLIRWSRHQYKECLDAARAQGKATAMILSGLNANKVNHDLYVQLRLENWEPAAEAPTPATPPAAPKKPAPKRGERRVKVAA